MKARLNDFMSSPALKRGSAAKIHWIGFGRAGSWGSGPNGLGYHRNLGSSDESWWSFHPPVRNRPSRWPCNTACARRLTSSFMKMFLTWDLIVSGELPRSRAISLLERPSPIRARIWHSRGLSRGSFWPHPGDQDDAAAIGALTMAATISLDARSMALSISVHASWPRDQPPVREKL
jgi:hypothetical protein